MGKSPEITVVIPAYNASRFIGETLESALGQTFSDIEVIVVDDCSTDSTVSLVESFSLSDPRVRLIALERNEGVAGARNAGVKEATGEWVALLDSDDLWELDKLEKQFSMATERRLDLVYSSYDLVDEEGRSLEKPFIVPESTSYEAMLAKNVFSCSTVMAKSDLMKRNPFSTDFYHEDYLLWMQLMRNGIRAGGITDVLMHYRQTGGSRSADKLNAAKHRWEIYRRGLGLGLFKSCAVFAGYAIEGFKKYYGARDGLAQRLNDRK